MAHQYPRMASPIQRTVWVSGGTALPAPAKIGLKRGTTSPSRTTTAPSDTTASSAGYVSEAVMVSRSAFARSMYSARRSITVGRLPPASPARIMFT